MERNSRIDIGVYDTSLMKGQKEGLDSEVYKKYKPKFIRKDILYRVRLISRKGMSWWKSLTFSGNDDQGVVDIEVWSIPLSLAQIMRDEKAKNKYTEQMLQTASGNRVPVMMYDRGYIVVKEDWIFLNRHK